MKSIKSWVLAGAMAVAATFAGSATAQAQDYVQGDLVLFFQNPGGTTGATTEVFASLGNTATVFRNNSILATPVNLINIVNIGSTLESAYGVNWASETTLWGGLGGVWGNASILNATLQNGDPNRTIYTSRPRTSVGTVGAAQSSGIGGLGDTNMTGIANSIITQYGDFAALANTTVAAIDPSNRVAGQNPSGAGGNAWNSNISGQAQQQGSAAAFGTFGPVSNVQFAWDLYRIQARDNISGQFDQGGGIRTGDFMGTVVLDGSGNVSFIAVPEPTSAALLGLGAMLLAARRRKVRTA